ncbi:MAG: HAMP domain-containing protein [Microcystis panniformis Mp_MB_F_20051200_S9]|uniref:HAMP domain-containing protein n=1 Tax=Microcystis panniformis Mp_MB_F_20051200_S9 TaxID=2486223 RepID=A0A552PUT1_9CHRO|nr:MAG: HAMP domain-containing protein [Microcystis panniformis Mp_MB_F_20080800_S26D]TRV47418.1 MAG: HAMP domain-containing protein [Microcystis panniformis Mp_GB_SS_20050300_S99]TRV54263.1 MAG: HAMP domain-containing protein [Microcystis panniformis Mp_GB_SS_20050300_S99D]TRV58376.1 MAG: HAMP domain-containing protein [Microcystis panniformis Mp_MB_F_20051200_S9D]TRV60124.1 MAG: HAMP domain-containing protein [Microcystis panniformis Mp_MB_F_20080800_S26]TRV60747.1 MAG: HAMP domain-containin
MPSGKEYAKLYGKANTAYCQGNLSDAAVIVKEMISKYPDDANVILLQGHIYVGLQQYSLAEGRYEKVLELAKNSANFFELVDYARRGLDRIQQLRFEAENGDFMIAAAESIAYSEAAFDPSQGFSNSWSGRSQAADLDRQEEVMDWDSGLFNDEDFGEPTAGTVDSYGDDFGESEETAFSSLILAGSGSHGSQLSGDSADGEPPFPFLETAEIDSLQEGWGGGLESTGEATFTADWRENPVTGRDQELSYADAPETSTFAIDPELPRRQGAKTDLNQGRVTQKRYEEDEARDFRELKLNDEDLDGFSQLRPTDIGEELGESELFTGSGEEALTAGFVPETRVSLNASSAVGEPNFHPSRLEIPDDKRDSHLGPVSECLLQPVVEVNPGKLAFFVNASLGKKQLILATLAGITPVVLIFAVSTTSWLSAKVAPKPAPIPPAPASLSPWSQPKPAMMLLTGLGTFALTWLGLQLLISEIKRSLKDLHNQFEHLSEGDFNAKATIYSEDEFGQLANRFNQMAKVVATITTLAQGRAAETERERKNLQRQVIRLLDDVEGAARGDLTVEAEVSADVLGAVADAFNLTIQNLREIVRQVKKAAKQVNQASTNSESFARNQSSDALRMAEELAVTLNSVQMMTDSIQRVAENAREAEEVARTSSITALKGGDSVERTVAGILQIRDTVSETARKVKRLAEASQEISKIVAVVSQIASRTNLLALNASIQAARAGDAGRGFAVVADEVRQLAYRSAKSLKEIEQIVLQIQSETGSVMMAMEEGIQQVIDVTERSEQAKKSLEDIIQVSNRIDTLVRSITADTVKQRENSLNVAQVMQSVELTAQETSQESQQVAGSLQKLVSISRELLSSVERFKIDSEDN